MSDVVKGLPVRRPYSRVYSPKRMDCGTVLGPSSVAGHLRISWDEVATVTEDYPASLLEDAPAEVPNLEDIEVTLDGIEDRVEQNQMGFQVTIRFETSRTILQIYWDSTFSVLVSPHEGPYMNRNFREMAILYQKVTEFLNGLNLVERL